MNEHDFRREYESLQHQVHASSDLKQRTLAAARPGLVLRTPG